jgi:ribosomal protein S18 acetylase RimI-like enzyme
MKSARLTVQVRREPVEAAGFVVVPCRFRDLRDVAAIQKQSFRPGLAYGYAQLALLWLLPNVTFLVARTRGNIIAGCLIADRYQGNVRVVNLAIDPGFRRQGVATMLLDAIQEQLPKGHVVLITEEFNEAAKSLYLREGFHAVGTARNYYGRGRNGIWMRKDRPTGDKATKIFV